MTVVRPGQGGSGLHLALGEDTVTLMGPRPQRVPSRVDRGPQLK